MKYGMSITRRPNMLIPYFSTHLIDHFYTSKTRCNRQNLIAF